MKRRWSLPFGLLIIAIAQVLVVVFGLPAAISFTYVCMTVAGLLFVLAARVDRLTVGPWTVRWYQFVGVADVLMALAMIASSPHAIDGSAGELIYTGAAVLGGLSLVWIGLDIARGGRHFDIGEDGAAN